jgi:hypothetical protein
VTLVTGIEIEPSESRIWPAGPDGVVVVVVVVVGVVVVVPVVVVPVVVVPVVVVPVVVVPVVVVPVVVVPVVSVVVVVVVVCCWLPGAAALVAANATSAPSDTTATNAATAARDPPDRGLPVSVSCMLVDPPRGMTLS